MISRAKIEAASDTLDDVAIESIITTVRTTAIYTENPAYYSDLRSKLVSVDGTLQAQQLNAALDEIENLGIGEVQINQSQTVGTDGVIYSKTQEREALVSYILGVLYEGISPSTYVTVDSDGNISSGDYNVGRLPIDYKGDLLCL